MLKIVPVDRDRHGCKRWRRPNGSEFSAHLAVASLGGSELSQAIGTFPIGFIERSPGSYMPVAVLALAKGGNLFVGPGGQWLGGYIPVVLRSYPFSLIRADNGEGGVLGIDEDSGLVGDGDGEGMEEFFAADGRSRLPPRRLWNWFNSRRAINSRLSPLPPLTNTDTTRVACSRTSC